MTAAAEPASVEPLAVGRGVVLKYGSHTALAQSDLVIPGFGITAIIGPNGSGKSTLLHALVGLQPVAAGSLTVLGRPPAEARDSVAYVLQTMSVEQATPITVLEAVGMGCYPQVGLWRRFTAAHRTAVADALQRLDIADLAHRHLFELSGGQRQRVFMAQGLVQEHRALLLDEPLTGLDLVSARAIDGIIHTERDGGTAIVLTTHDLDEARAADYVILVSGRVVAHGPPDLVCTRPNLEVAFGLGTLHDWEGFIDDPAHDPHRHPDGHWH